MRVSGLKVNMATAKTIYRLERFTKDFLWIINETDSANVHGLTVENIEGIGKITEDMVSENINNFKIFTKEILTLIGLLDMASTSMKLDNISEV